MKILLVEDDLEISKLLAEFLQENGYEAFCQYDGLHVLDCLRENNIDLILLDIMLPYRNGDTVLTAVREWSIARKLWSLKELLDETGQSTSRSLCPLF